MNLRMNNDRGLTTDNDDVIRCEIVKLFQPSNLSCVMEVKLLNQNTRAVLKLYDRRFALGLRSAYNMKPSTTATEIFFGEFVKSGDASKFLNRLRNYYYTPKDGWNMAHYETYLQYLCIIMFRSELMVYDKLKNLQGKELPYLLAQVRLPLSSSQDIMGSVAADDPFEIKGILLEFIDGCNLFQIANVPREDWREVCEEAVRVIRLLDDFSILNIDVSPSNIMVCQSASEKEKKYRVVMLDFGRCSERLPGESDTEWGRAKWNENEEGAIGLVMQRRLKRDFAYDWPFHHSERFEEWAAGEDDLWRYFSTLRF